MLWTVGVGDLFQADVGGGPKRVSRATEHRVLDVDLFEVELPVGDLAVAAPEEDERRGLVLLGADRHPARRAPGEELVDLLGHVTNGALPIVEEDLHADGLWVAPLVVGLPPRLVLHVRWGLPLGTLADRVLAGVEREFQGPRPISRLQLRAYHLRHLFLFPLR